MIESLLPHLEAAARFLCEGNEFLLTSHVGSDGDGIGGCLALAGALTRMGKRAAVILPDAPDPHFDFLSGFSRIVAVDQHPELPVGWAVVVDAPSLARTGGVAGRIGPPTRVLNIDHHPDNQRFGSTNLVSPEVSSSSEMIYHLLATMGQPLDAEVATALYAGMIFDTGGFRFSLTTPTTFEVAAVLVRLGVRLDRVADRVFGQKTLGEVQQLGRAIDTLTLHFEGRVAVMHLDHAEMAVGDPEEVVNYGLLVRGVEVSVLIREPEPGHQRVSLRSRESVDVSRIAAQFGGGGHCRAAGYRFTGTRESGEEPLLAVLGKQWAG
jgi:phosphoesterase RecJ-like protein